MNFFFLLPPPISHKIPINPVLLQKKPFEKKSVTGLTSQWPSFLVLVVVVVVFSLSLTEGS